MIQMHNEKLAYQQGYEDGYRQGKADTLDHCEKCETDQWDALYKAEMKGRADAIEECIDIVEHSFECFLSGTAQGCVRWNMEQLKEQKNE